MSWASAVTNTAIVKNTKEKNPAVLYFIFNLLCVYRLIIQLSYVFDGPILHVNELESYLAVVDIVIAKNIYAGDF